jgi:superfamily II DNA or RNA helicase
MKPQVSITMGNRRSRIDCGEDLDALETVQKLFRFHPDGYQYMPTYTNRHWDGYIHLFKNGWAPTGLVLTLIPSLQKHADVVVLDQRQETDFQQPNKAAWEQARTYQQQCYLKMLTASRTGGLILQCTGSGKTFVAGLYFSALVGHGMFFVDELTLLEQARRAIQSVTGEAVGKIGGGSFDPQRLTVATLQTLSHPNRRTQTKKLRPDVVIIDEIHEAINDRTRKVLDLLQPRAVFGLTATLQLRKKAVRYQAAAMAGPVVFDYPLETGTEEGYLASGVVVRVCSSFGVASMLRYSDRETKYLDGVVNNAQRNQFIAELVKVCAARRHPTVVLVDRLLHLDNLRAALGDHPTRVLSGEDPQEDRTSAIEEMKAGRLLTIVTNKIFGKGVDIPNLEVTIDATGRASHNRAMQRLGRASRRAEGKRGFIHFDVADTHLPATAERLKAYHKLKARVFSVTGTSVTPHRLLKMAERKLDKLV